MTGFGLAGHGVSVEHETHPARPCLTALEPLWLSPTAGRLLLTWQAEPRLSSAAQLGLAPHVPGGLSSVTLHPAAGRGKGPHQAACPPECSQMRLLNQQRVVLTAWGPTPHRG